jgi:hypothetical protein
LTILNRLLAPGQFHGPFLCLRAGQCDNASCLLFQHQSINIYEENWEHGSTGKTGLSKHKPLNSNFNYLVPPKNSIWKHNQRPWLHLKVLQLQM